MKKLSNLQIALAAIGAVIGLGRHAVAQDTSAAATQPAAGAATQPSATPLFTEDFESGQIDKSKWETRIAPNSKATVAVVTDKSAHGKSSLQVHYPMGDKGYAFIVATHLPDAVRQHFFGRAYVFAGPNPLNSHDVAILGGTPGWPISNFLEIGLHDTHLQPSFQWNDFTPEVKRGETVPARTQTFPVGKWFCLEWEFNNQPDTITLWIDGKQVEKSAFTFNGTKTDLIHNTTVQGFYELALGYRAWGAGGKNDFDIYYDDIAIGASRIGQIAGPVNGD